MSGTDSLIAELRGHLEHGISSEAIEAAADTIATLNEDAEANRRIFLKNVQQLNARAEALTAERDALREALAPFAKEAEYYYDYEDTTPRIDLGCSESREAEYTASDLRRARALAKGECK